MPELKDIARVSMRGRDLDEDDIQTQAWMLWSHMRDKDTEATPLKDQPGYSWTGSIHELVLDLWPSLPSQRTDPVTAKMRTSLVTYLRDTGNVICLQKGNMHRQSVWWLRDTFSYDPPKPAPPTPKELASTYAERKLTPHEAGEDREPALVETQHQCPKCPARFNSRQALQVHKAKLGDRPHPQGSFPCKHCHEVFSAAERLANHFSRFHAKVGQSVCHSCGEITPNRGASMRHQIEVHGALYGRAKVSEKKAASAFKLCTKCGLSKSRDEFYRRKAARDGLQAWCKKCWTGGKKPAEKESVVDKLSEDTKVTNEIVADPASITTAQLSPVDDPVAAVTRIVDDNRRLSDENASLRAKLEEIQRLSGGS